MAIESFFAPEINQAIGKIKQVLGDDAIIINQQKINGGILVTASSNENVLQQNQTENKFEILKVKEALEYHGVEKKVVCSILDECKNIAGSEVVDENILERALAKVFKFHSLMKHSNRLQMFVGTPGVGKSTIIAKLATKAKMDNISVAIVSTDNLRAGANQQLKTMADILDVDFYFYKDPQNLFEFLQKSSKQYDKVLIDTPGINPFVDSEVEKVSAFTDVFKGDKILTADACRNVLEAVEIADIFKNMGTNLLLPTRLDLTRRIGGVLSAAFEADMGLCAVGIGASITKGLADIDAQKLSKLILQ